jgi:hypothetical protein
MIQVGWPLVLSTGWEWTYFLLARPELEFDKEI